MALGHTGGDTWEQGISPECSGVQGSDTKEEEGAPGMQGDGTGMQGDGVGTQEGDRGAGRWLLGTRRQPMLQEHGPGELGHGIGVQEGNIWGQGGGPKTQGESPRVQRGGPGLQRSVPKMQGGGPGDWALTWLGLRVPALPAQPPVLIWWLFQLSWGERQ